MVMFSDFLNDNARHVIWMKSNIHLIVMAFGSNNFSGSLPPELGNLVKLEQIYIDSSGVSGDIPSTFAKLQNMQILWASDNLFTGKIPDFISHWTKLTTLRISELSNVSSSLDFIKDMKDLNTLVLRNCIISGSIPSNIGEYQKLQRLDLSFNNLTGLIPSRLFDMISLSHLFLGNNSLSGMLPSQRSQTLLTIDLSYNELSGRFPPWVTPNSQCVFPGLHCLQKKFPCNRDSPRYANFSINCGGKEMRSSEGVVFEAENSTLGPASYYVVDTHKWAVSNVGLFAERGDVDDVETTQIDNILNSDFFQTARQSPGSLRYYGLGLESGSYTVNLYFTEKGFDDESSLTWQSLGRRVFDIYIQGNLQLKDFDIRKEAGGASNRAVQKNFTAQVSENYLEIHLLWAGKGTCCIPEQGYYGPSISAINVVSDFQPTVRGLPPTTASRKKNKTGLIVSIGILLDGRVAAVKKLSVASHQGKTQFISEIAIISAVQHRNLVKLYGCCIERDKKLLAWTLHENNRVLELVDPTLTIFDKSEAIRMIGVALLCTQASPLLRPPMSRVVTMLAGDIEVSSVTTRPGYLTDWQFNDITSGSVNDETCFDDIRSLNWESLGSRVFDIYIQGNLRLKDFDIRKEAGGVSNRAIPKNFTAQASENYLEIHLFWAGKGTCCIPAQGYYGPSISAISVFSVFYLRRKSSGSNEDEELLGIGLKPNMFSYADLRTATEDFNPENDAARKFVNKINK
ncbi:hypothetical protein HHK36_004740 [Tetracentron sinense]|uniref:non-specific serine/threonine protein kinase n=1 Tax=Tetracentron sinense TaxID=13715 RepID=A0A835DQG9_TETSI|nr:hypothetical protein HHK36_004740 [Tetracentron sinense]